MRVDNTNFREKNVAAQKAPRHVISIEFGVSNIEYFVSHAGVTGIPGTPLYGSVARVSGFSQRVQPEKGVSTIGQMSFALLDEGAGVAALLKAYNDAGVGVRDKTVRFYLGYDGLDFSDFTLYQTQKIIDVREQSGTYLFSCADIQRSFKEDIFPTISTNITSSISDTDTTIPVIDTGDFETFQNLASSSDAPGADVVYLKIEKTGEIVRVAAADIAAGQFNNVTRGVLGTTATAVDVTATQDERKPKISQHVFLEMPGPLLAYGILTGDLLGFGTLPDSYNLGIDPSDVRSSDFSGIGADLFDPTDVTAGKVLRFEGIGQESGKQFLEEEIYRLLGLFPVVYSTGEIGIRRAAPILANAPAVVELDERHIESLGALQHDLKSMRNRIAVLWNWTGDDFTRRVLFTDASSIAKHGNAPELELSFRGLHGSRHTDATIAQTIDSLRDRYAAPPLRLPARLLHSQNALEIGDIVRINANNVRDYTGDATKLNRSFEIQQVSVNHQTGAVSLELFGSSEAAAPYSPTSAASALPSGFYTSEGTALSSVLTISGSPARVTASGTLNGSATDIGAAGAIFYHDGDLQIDPGVTVTIGENVQLRVNGFLTINGTIDGAGNGIAGTTEGGSYYNDFLNNPENWEGSPGYVGATQPGGVTKALGYLLSHVGIPATPGKYSAFPYLDLDVDDSGTGAIVGLPSDLRGGGGGQGGMYKQGVSGAEALGGAGGDGGAGLLVVCKGLGFGGSGLVTLSGSDGDSPAAPAAIPGGAGNAYGGGGAGGGPGSFLILLDGSGISVPIVETGDFISKTGAVPTPGTPIPTVQYNAGEDGSSGPYSPYQTGLSEVDNSSACLRIQYLPDQLVPEEDEPGATGPINGLSTYVTYSDNARDNPPATPTGDGNVSSVWNRDPALLAGAVNWISFKTAVSLTAGSWDLPILFTGAEGLPGDPGDPGDPGADGLSVVELQIYKRATSTPATPTGGSFEFGGAGLTPPTGWSTDIPSGTDPVYACTGVASIVGQSGTDSSITWSAPVKVFQEGAALDIVFIRSATQPSTPSPSVGVPSGWSSDVSTAPGTGLLWSSVGTRANSGDNWVWQLPAQVEGDQGDPGDPGDPGADGLSVAELIIYKRATSTPATPTGGSYTFPTPGLSPPTGWSGSIPAGSTPVYASVGVASIVGTTGTDSSISWSTPVKVFQEGAAVDIVFIRSATQPSTPSPSAGVPSGWSSDVSTAPGTGLLWSSVGTRANSGDNWVWQLPAQVEGDQGDPGEDAYPLNLTPTYDWTIPVSDPMGAWNEIGGTLARSQVLNNIRGPYGQYPNVLRTLGSGSIITSWVAEWQRYLDRLPSLDQGIISFTWVKRVGSGHSGLYFGWTYSGGSDTLEGAGSPYSPSGNPYFIAAATAASLVDLDQWYLVVGYIAPANSTLGDPGISGIYDPNTGRKIFDGADWRFMDSFSGPHYLRFGFYGGSNAWSTSQGYDFNHIGTFLVDGSEPEIADVLRRNPKNTVAFFDGFDDYKSVDELAAAYFDHNTFNPSAFSFADGANTGGKVLNVAGEQVWLAARQLIPYSPNKLYKVSCRVRLTAAPTDSAKDLFYCGVEGVGFDGLTRINANGDDSFASQHYHAASSVDLGTIGLNTWAEFKAYFTGHSATPSTGAGTKASPRSMYTGVAYIRPLAILNYTGGDGTMQLDFLKIEVVDDDFGDLAGEDAVSERISGTSTSTSNPPLTVTGHDSVGNQISIACRITHTSYTNANTAYSFQIQYRKDGGTWTELITINESHPAVKVADHVSEGGGYYTNALVVDIGYLQPAIGPLGQIPGAGVIDYRINWLTRPAGASLGTYFHGLKTEEVIL